MNKNIVKIAPVNNKTDVVVTNYYIANSMLVNIKSGSVTIRNLKNLTDYTLTKGVYFIKKDIFVGVLNTYDKDKLLFDIIDIPVSMLNYFCRENSDVAENRNEWIIKTIIPGCDELIKKIEDGNGNLTHSDGINTHLHCHSIDIDKNITYILCYLLSNFLEDGKIPFIIHSSAELTLTEKIYDIIYADTRKNWTLESISKKIYLSKSTLKRKLKAEGTTFSTIFLLARMKKAARLLRTNNNSIRAIAEECGFNNPSYFSTVFRKIFNTIPKKYRELF
ncbi:TPA: helix-turn-helix domain-containing protein [Escherichia coli]|nr:helix-turn-helix domain-containing protein [Escherichia coli]HAJ4146551.1 helix-turn-helix domain-containing protein [Escherichia coli]